MEIQGIRTLLTANMGGVIEKLTEEINNLTGIDAVSVIISVHILSLIKWFDNAAKYERLTEKTQALEKATIDGMQPLRRIVLY